METDQPTPTQKQANKIFSYKPKGEQLTFLESLISEKGSMTKALEHCVDLSMNPRGGDIGALLQTESFKKQIKDSQKVIDEYIVREKELHREIKANEKFINDYIGREKQFQAEISNLKSQISNLCTEPKSEKKSSGLFLNMFDK